MRQGFPLGVSEQIKSYVYMLLDPRTSPPEPFYVGKGVGDRIFAHLRVALTSPQESDKLDRIRSIIDTGQEVRHVILRHGLEPECAFEVEAAFIDFIENLTNVAGGYRSSTRGLMTVEDVIAEYEARPVSITEPGLLIKINKLYRRGMSPEELYHATRKSWVVGARRSGVKYGFAVAFGVVREVYRISEWYPSEDNPARWAFRGAKATELEHYIGGSVAAYFTKGEAFPVKYLNC